MAQIQIPPDSTGKYVDTAALTDGLVTVQRQKIVLAGGSGTAEVVAVTNAAPAGTEMGLAVRQVGTATVAGVVGLTAGTANIGSINNISATVTVAGRVVISGTAAVVIGAGVANIGLINNISATVTVAGSINISTMPAVVLAAGAANIGIINNISATVNVAGNVTTTITSIDFISATTVVAGNVNISTMPAVVLAAGAANIGTVNNVSATVTVAGRIVVSGTATVAGVVGLTAGTANIGSINNISATVTVAGSVVISGTATVAGFVTADAHISQLYVPTANPSASRGPRCVVVSTSSNVTLVAAPGAGMAIYVTQVFASNAAGSNTRVRVGTSASIGQVQAMLAASGGGFVSQYKPLYKLSSNEALVGSCKPNASEVLINVNFFVASADAL